jgi:hypothetical protein
LVGQQTFPIELKNFQRFVGKFSNKFTQKNSMLKNIPTNSNVTLYWHKIVQNNTSLT